MKMYTQFKRLWGLYIALFIVACIIAVPTTWIYQVVLHQFGQDIAAMALALLVAIVAISAMHGVMYAARIESLLRGQVMTLMNPPRSGTIIRPFVFKVLGMVLFRYPETAFKFTVNAGEVNDAVYQLGTETPTCYRGKQPRFPEEKIRKAVMKWVNRDKTFTTMTLPEFLEQEFGTGPDGVLLMAPSTFYDWRARILDEVKAGQKKVNSL